VELHDYDRDLFRKWLASGVDLDEFSSGKYRGRMTGKKFGI
jgi:hypothetical protein